MSAVGETKDQTCLQSPQKGEDDWVSLGAPPQHEHSAEQAQHHLCTQQCILLINGLLLLDSQGCMRTLETRLLRTELPCISLMVNPQTAAKKLFEELIGVHKPLAAEVRYRNETRDLLKSKR
eukprot:scaffold29095_cov30-Prasinocladus_malaysianus.AAC.1